MDAVKLTEAQTLVRQARRECADAETADSHILALFRAVARKDRRAISAATTELITAGATAATCAAIVDLKLKERELAPLVRLMEADSRPQPRKQKAS